ncbi:unnamed protein product [Soboliphyme baturini]|uniref:SERPIN domain-containing protein n=1 Tax=Soboliphyme baturini TaxID=241478 RepID=A0A183J5Y2_9BILA|nr:unnamed protein product [Soboliphyme baturini]
MDLQRVLANFSVSLYNNAMTQCSSCCLSPYAVLFELFIIHYACDKIAAAQLRKVLFPGARLYGNFRHFSSALYGIPNTEEGDGLSFNSLVLLDKTYNFASRFKRFIRVKTVRTSIEIVDFADLASVSSVVNKKVKDESANHLNGVMDETKLRTFYKLLLNNAAYFDGPSAEFFSSSFTKEEKFYMDDSDRSVTVQMMHKIFLLPYQETREVQIVAFPFRPSVAIYIVLPWFNHTLKQIETSLTSKKLSNWLTSQYDYKVDVRIPKFTLQSTLKLKDALRNMGVRDIFDRYGSLPGISDNSMGLSVSEIFHEAVMQVDLNGKVSVNQHNN